MCLVSLSFNDILQAASLSTIITVGGLGSASWVLSYFFVPRYFMSYSSMCRWAAAMHPEHAAITSASQLLIAIGIWSIELAGFDYSTTTEHEIAGCRSTSIGAILPGRIGEYD